MDATASHPNRTHDEPAIYRPRGGWTTREDAVLREHYAAEGAAACAPLLPGRTHAAIMTRANYIGLKVTHRPRGGRPQLYPSTPAIDARIRAWYAEHPQRGAGAELARELGWPRWRLTRRAQELGCVPVKHAGERPWSEDELRILRDYSRCTALVVTRALRAAGYRRSPSAVTQARAREVVDPRILSAAGVARALGRDRNTVLHWIRAGWLDADRRTGTPGTEEQHLHWVVTHQQLREFITTHPNLIDLRRITDGPWFIGLVAGK